MGRKEIKWGKRHIIRREMEDIKKNQRELIELKYIIFEMKK